MMSVGELNMKCLIIDQGTAAHETGICDSCFAFEFNKQYIRDSVKYYGDINLESDFYVY